MSIDIDVPVEVAERALRTVRPSVYRLDGGEHQTTITLTVSAGEAGRRNAAERVLAALSANGIEVRSDDPAADLTRGTSLTLALRAP